MKSASTQIYQLIHALSKSEKRYFSLFAQRHQIGEANNYLQLFRLIERENVLSDAVLRPYIKDLPFAAYLSVAKKQLMEKLLEALCDFHESASIDEKIKSHCHKANILFEKGLIKESRKYLKRAKKDALAFERFSLILEVLEIQKKIIARQYYNDSSIEDLEALNRETIFYLKIIENRNAYWLLFSKIYKQHFKESSNRKDRDENQLLEWLNDPLLEKVESALSLSAQLDFWQLKALKHFINRNPKEAFHVNQQFLAIFDEQEHLLQTQTERYRSTLNNFLIDCAQLNKEQELKAGLKKLRALPEHKAFKKLKDTQIHVFRLGYQLEMNWNISQGDFDKNCALVPELIPQLKHYQSALVEQSLVVFYYLIAYSFFGTAQYDSCMDWSNKLIHETSENVMESLQSSARILNLLAHFELGNTELLIYSTENLKRYFRKKKRLFEAEKILLSGLGKLARQSVDKHAGVYQKMAVQFKEMKTDSSFDFNCWVKAKMEGKEYGEVFRAVL